MIEGHSDHRHQSNHRRRHKDVEVGGRIIEFMYITLLLLNVAYCGIYT